jgi:hypothetical protein
VDKDLAVASPLRPREALLPGLAPNLACREAALQAQLLEYSASRRLRQLALVSFPTFALKLLKHALVFALPARQHKYPNIALDYLAGAQKLLLETFRLAINRRRPQEKVQLLEQDTRVIALDLVATILLAAGKGGRARVPSGRKIAIQV